METFTTDASKDRLRRAVQVVAILNLAYFTVEFGTATAIGSVSLFADSIDFLEDTAVNFLIFMALRWDVRKRARVGMVLAAVLLIPSLAALWAAIMKLTSQVPPNPVSLSTVGAGALAVNLICAFVLVRYRHHSGSLTKAAFLSARNDAFADISIVAAGFATHYYQSFWPDLIVGAGIILINADASRQVFRAARAEHQSAMRWS